MMKQNCITHNNFTRFLENFKKAQVFFQFLQSYILCIQQTITTYLLLLLFGQPKKFVRIQVTRRTLLSTLSINK